MNSKSRLALARVVLDLADENPVASSMISIGAVVAEHPHYAPKIHAAVVYLVNLINLLLQGKDVTCQVVEVLEPASSPPITDIGRDE